MAHPAQAEFFSSVRTHYPTAFTGARVLEVGSLDINGSVRELFANCQYVGVDLQLGRGVDLACQGQLVEFPSGHFDTTISAECLEHNPYWRETVANMLRMTRPRRTRADQLRNHRPARTRHLANQPGRVAVHVGGALGVLPQPGCG